MQMVMDPLVAVTGISIRNGSIGTNAGAMQRSPARRQENYNSNRSFVELHAYRVEVPVV